jgi:hypothetical protein
VALWIKAIAGKNGSHVEVVYPERGKSFKLGELQRCVGGYSQPLPLHNENILRLEKAKILRLR